MSEVTDSPAAADPIETILKSVKRIAVVGLGGEPRRPATYVSEYLKDAGYDIVPVHPRSDEAIGLPVVRSLADVQPPPDLVCVFRRAEFTPEVAKEAVAAGAKVLWLQSGIHHPEAERIAREGGVEYVSDRCMMVEHLRVKG